MLIRQTVVQRTVNGQPTDARIEYAYWKICDLRITIFDTFSPPKDLMLAIANPKPKIENLRVVEAAGIEPASKGCDQ